MTQKELKAILDKHKMWLSGKAGGERADLRRASLRMANLHGADLHMANLCMASLRGADLHGADLRRANLHGADLSEADLRRASLCEANLRGADLSGADLHGADLRVANLCEANLRGANLDYSCWTLWCGSLDVKVDARIARQLAYHFCRLDCDDPEYLEARESIAEFANGFHRVDECGRIET